MAPKHDDMVIYFSKHSLRCLTLNVIILITSVKAGFKFKWGGGGGSSNLLTDEDRSFS